MIDLSIPWWKRKNYAHPIQCSFTQWDPIQGCDIPIAGCNVMVLVPNSSGTSGSYVHKYFDSLLDVQIFAHKLCEDYEAAMWEYFQWKMQPPPAKRAPSTKPKLEISLDDLDL